ncbi:hypothetical protein GCM10020331_074950 [Ectobacillus funiculus]
MNEKNLAIIYINAQPRNKARTIEAMAPLALASIKILGTDATILAIIFTITK